MRRAARTATPPPNLDALALFAGEDAEAVVLDLVPPAGSGWRIGDERRFARADEADQADFAPTRRGSAPDYVHGEDM